MRTERNEGVQSHRSSIVDFEALPSGMSRFDEEA
jgi:hypothetical protein